MMEPEPIEPMEDPGESRTMRVMNDPRVSGFLRFLNPVLAALTLASVLTIGSLISDASTTIQKLTWVVEDLAKRTDTNEKDINTIEGRLNDVTIDVRVLQQNQRQQSWEVNRLSRKVKGEQ
jgi:hypothetical protein